jgi:hypothetical protein
VEALKEKRANELDAARTMYFKINSERNEIINKENDEKAQLEKKRDDKVCA